MTTISKFLFLREETSFLSNLRQFIFEVLQSITKYRFMKIQNQKYLIYRIPNHSGWQRGKNYEEKEGATRPTGVHLGKLEYRYIDKQREIEEKHLTQQPPWLSNNTYFCYDRESPTNNNNKKHF